jgi:hypothetical protein
MALFLGERKVKAVVFSQFVQFLDVVQEAVTAGTRSYRRLPRAA